MPSTIRGRCTRKRIFANTDLLQTELAQLLAERKSVLYFLSADITALKTRVASEDKARLDAHLTSIRTLWNKNSARRRHELQKPPHDAG